MTSEQVYFFTVALINLVLAFSGTRVNDPEGKQKSILFFIIAFSANFISWFLYVFDINTLLKIISVTLSSIFIWGMVVFSFKRCELKLPIAFLSTVFIINCLAQAYFTYENNLKSALHVSALFVPLAFSIIGYQFIKIKKHRNPSDIILAYAFFFMAIVVAARSVLLEFSPELFSNTIVSSQIIWPAFSVISGVFALLSFTEEAQLKLKEESHTDQLTTLANRRSIDVTLGKEWARARRHGRPLALVMLDIDFFKKYNDNYGHQAGDECLKAVARALQGGAQRAEDLVARYGGEEFLLILPDTDAVTAQRLAERVCATIAELEIPHEQSPLSLVTVSAGTAVLTKGLYKDADGLLRAADKALYQAKQNGRNQAQLAPYPATQWGPDEHASGSFVQLAWHTTYECGNRIIDDQHQALFAQINDILAAVLSGKSTDYVGAMLDALVADVAQHFQDEESVLASIGFPDSEEHIAIHRHLIKRATELVSQFHVGQLGIGELFQFLAHDVVARHILNADRKFFPLLATPNEPLVKSSNASARVQSEII